VCVCVCVCVRARVLFYLFSSAVFPLVSRARDSCSCHVFAVCGRGIRSRCSVVSSCVELVVVSVDVEGWTCPDKNKARLGLASPDKCLRVCSIDHAIRGWPMRRRQGGVRVWVCSMLTGVQHLRRNPGSLVWSSAQSSRDREFRWVVDFVLGSEKGGVSNEEVKSVRSVL